jgi:hypothetical protein
MTLSDFATFSTAISGLAVTASLIYLALQTHQSVKHTKALIHQGRAARMIEVQKPLFDVEVAGLMIRLNGGDPSTDAIDKYRLAAFIRINIFNWQDTFEQYRSGLLNEEAFGATRVAIATVLSLPENRAEWKKSRLPGTAFAAYVDEIVAATPLRSI